MNHIPADDSDTPAVCKTVASMIAAARRSNDFFESRRPLTGQQRPPQVTQMTQEEDDDIWEDSSVESSSASPPLKRNKPTPRKKVNPDIDNTSSASSTPQKSGDWMGRLGTQKSIPIRKSKRIQSKQKPPVSKTSVAVSPVNREPTMLKLQVGALVKNYVYPSFIIIKWLLRLALSNIN